MMIDLRYEFGKLRTKAMFAVAWSLPRWLVYFCGIRIMAAATTGKYADTVVPELEGTEAIKRWEDGA